jgi:hypothetical protein
MLQWPPLLWNLVMNPRAHPAKRSGARWAVPHGNFHADTITDCQLAPAGKPPRAKWSLSQVDLRRRKRFENHAKL